MSNLQLPNVDVIHHIENLRVMFITGAGISVDSGVPTYYGEGGFYEGKSVSPEDILNISQVRTGLDKIWKEIYPLYDIIRTAQPNIAHHVINDMKYKFKDYMILTQNVDGLHGKQDDVIEIHGNVDHLRCDNCGQHGRNPLKPVGLLSPTDNSIPRCPQCNSSLRPDIVLFGESYDQLKIEKIKKFIDLGVDLIFVVGTKATLPIIWYTIKRIVDSSPTCKVYNVNPEPLSSPVWLPVIETGMKSSDYFRNVKISSTN